MLNPADNAYIKTKELKLGRATLNPPFKECVERLRAVFPRVSILNAVHETIPPDNIPRLTVVVEYEREQRTFIGGDFVYDKDKQSRAKEEFKGALTDAAVAGFDTDRLFVIFSDFEGVARLDAAEKIKKAETEKLLKRLKIPSLWTIETIFDRVDFLFLTDDDERRAPEELKERLKREYSALVSQYDEFGYLAERPLYFYFSSKETFERDYQSNWFYYFR